jgi:hypothetical protein
MKRRSHGRAPARGQCRNRYAEQGGHAPKGENKFTPPKQQDAHSILPSIGLLKSIFGKDKVERVLSAARFSWGDARFRRHAGGRYAMRRLGLLLVLLFLQSLFIAIDYLPVTLELLSRDRTCTYLPVPPDKPTEQSGK